MEEMLRMPQDKRKRESESYSEKAPPYALTEHQIQQQILDWLKLKRIFHYRQNSGGIKKGSRFVKFGAPGAPDIICVIKGAYVGIEVKRVNGMQSRQQFCFQKSLEKAGGYYYLVQSLDDVMEVLK
jgi:hypothetical protein